MPAKNNRSFTSAAITKNLNNTLGLSVEHNEKIKKFAKQKQNLEALETEEKDLRNAIRKEEIESIIDYVNHAKENIKTISEDFCIISNEPSTDFSDLGSNKSDEESRLSKSDPNMNSTFRNRVFIERTKSDSKKQPAIPSSNAAEHISLQRENNDKSLDR